MNVLALDLATRTGWALFENGAEESGHETFDVRRGESPGMRFVRFNRWLDDFLLRPVGEDLRARVDLIVYEQTLPSAPGALAREIETGFATRVQEFCARYDIEHQAPLYPAQLKKWTTGHGNAKKPAMLEAVARRWRRVDDHNEADAIALLHYALDVLVPTAAGARA